MLRVSLAAFSASTIRTGLVAAILVSQVTATMPAQGQAGAPDSAPGTDLKSRVRTHLQSLQSSHLRVQRLFEPMNKNAAENQVQSVLRQIAQNRERWAGEMQKLKELGEGKRLEEDVKKQRAAVNAANLGEEGVELTNRLNEFLRDLDAGQKQFDTDLALLEQDAKGILATAAALNMPIVLLTGQEDANKLVSKFVRSQLAKGGFGVGPEQAHPATVKPPLTPAPPATPKDVQAGPPSSTIFSSRPTVPPQTSLSPTPKQPQAVSSQASSAGVSIETVARSLFRAIENRDLEWITDALDNPLEYYQQGSIPSSKVIAIIQSDWRRYSNWRGTISDFRSTDPLSCTFTLSYSLLEGNRARAASMKHTLSLSPHWPHRITKINGFLLTGDTGSAARPVGQPEELKSSPSAPPAPEKRYRINNLGGQTKVLLKRRPDPTSETVTQVPNTTTDILIMGEPAGADRNWIAVKIGNLSGYFLPVENLSLMDAPRLVSITPGKVEQSWASAVSKYPELGVHGSYAQERFSLRVRAAKLSDPHFFNNSGWPLAAANQIFAAEQRSAPVPDARKAEGWRNDPTFKAVEQAMTNMYTKLTEQFGTSPLTGQLRGEQAAWVEKRNALASTQPAELQTAVAIQMTSDRVKRLDGLRQIVDRPATGWKMYSGALPPGRSMHFEQAAFLTSPPVGTPVYVGGTLVVTAVSGNRVVFRDIRFERGSDVRLVVEYPEGMRLPAEGSVITRPPDRGFLVQQIRRPTSDTTEILAREILSK